MSKPNIICHLFENIVAHTNLACRTIRCYYVILLYLNIEQIQNEVEK